MLEGPPGRMWRSFPHRKAILAAGDFPDLGFLVEVRMLRRLMVTHSSVGDIGAVNSLTKLEELDVWVLGTQPRGEVDLQNLPALRRLAFDETLPIQASVARSLEDLVVEKLDGDWAGNLPMLPGLRKLQLTRPTNTASNPTAQHQDVRSGLRAPVGPDVQLQRGHRYRAAVSHRHPRDA